MQNIGTNVNSISRQWPLSAHQKCWRAPSIIPISIFMKVSRLSRRDESETPAQGFNARAPRLYATAEWETFKGSPKYPDTSSTLTLPCSPWPPLVSRHLEMIPRPICFVCMYGSSDTDTSAAAERLGCRQAESGRGEKQTLSRPCGNPAIFHHQLLSCSRLSGQSPQSPGSLVRQDASTDAEGRERPRVGRFARLCLRFSPGNGTLLNVGISERCETLKRFWIQASGGGGGG